MKKLLKPMIVVLLAVTLVILVSLPPKLSAIDWYPGWLFVWQGTYNCVCPLAGNCQCGFLEPKE
jgi:hypothetical protein